MSSAICLGVLKTLHAHSFFPERLPSLCPAVYAMTISLKISACGCPGWRCPLSDLVTHLIAFALTVTRNPLWLWLCVHIRIRGCMFPWLRCLPLISIRIRQCHWFPHMMDIHSGKLWRHRFLHCPCLWFPLHVGLWQSMHHMSLMFPAWISAVPFIWMHFPFPMFNWSKP